MPVMMVSIIAKQTGWAPRTVWHMYYPAALQYLHASMLVNGRNTRWAHLTADEEEDVDHELENNFTIK